MFYARMNLQMLQHLSVEGNIRMFILCSKMTMMYLVICAPYLLHLPIIFQKAQSSISMVLGQFSYLSSFFHSICTL